ncbi:fimbria/pilus outer membrane usher protein [Bordetella sp. N]|uniref:fimbria/pilus outer membrane usher protein n=1 Tax=Bordetella sp. N TaxID=1746199 RepID=UPI00070FABB3|nr:fimbria/pilus outer membrane usher protein [Bordetella sp. N]ALM84161.1 fimbrial protein [Bordetella sp. N]
MAGRLRERTLQGLAATCACVTTLAAHAQVSAPPQRPGSATAASHEVYLTVSFNGDATTLISRFIETGGRLYASRKDLMDLGVSAAGLPAGAPDMDVPLDRINGLTYRYDAGQQSVDLRLPDRLRRPYDVDTRGLQPTPPASSGRGLLINYDAYAQTQGRDSLALWTEERYFSPSGVISNTGIGYLYGPQRKYVRYDSSWSRSDPTTLRTTQVGDMITSSLDWSRSIRLGGLQWRRNFALRPDLVTFPLPTLGGSAVVPSAVDVYINNVRQYSGNVPSGPFVVNSVPGITGAGTASVVTRDALGRPVQTTLPIYIDSRMLSAGLSSYSAEFGFLRRNYGLTSFDYDRSPAGSGSLRYGISDALTLEAHTEASSGVYNAGGGALVRLGSGGVINGSLAGSTGRNTGMQAGVGYQYIRPDFSLDARSTRKFGNYGDLAAADGTPVADSDDRITLAVPLGKRQTVALSFLNVAYPGVDKSHVGSVAYSYNAGYQITFNVNAYKDFGRGNTNGVFFSVSIGLGDGRSGSASVGRQNGDSTYNVGAVQTPDYGGGWGWGLQKGRNGPSDYNQGWGQYLGRYGQATATAQSYGGESSVALDLNGSVVLMDGHVEPSRQIYDGFTLVSTDGVGGVPVLSQNRVIGNTSSGGYLLVPNLNSYQHNQVGIDSLKLPPDARIESTEQDVVPQALSGVVTRFGLTRYSAASIVLHDAAGKPLPVGTRVQHVEGNSNTIVGYDGITFVDGLAPHNTLSISNDKMQCTVTFDYQRPQDGSLPTLGPYTCAAAGGGR